MCNKLKPHTDFHMHTWCWVPLGAPKGAHLINIMKNILDAKAGDDFSLPHHWMSKLDIYEEFEWNIMPNNTFVRVTVVPPLSGAARQGLGHKRRRETPNEKIAKFTKR